MMKSILISIQPQWVEKILNGEKTIEIRKVKPKCALPCKVYIYCTKSFDSLRRFPDDSSFGEFRNKFDITNHNKYSLIPNDIWNGNVVAEFILKKTECWRPKGMLWGTTTKKTCLSLKQLIEYADTNNKLKEHCYAWFISDLKIYDTPKELSEFYSEKECPFKDWGDVDNIGCWESCCEIWSRGDCKFGHLKLDKPPQSWCYIEKVGD